MLQASKTNGDIVTNSIMRQGAYDQCALRQCALIEWWADASKSGAKYPYCDWLREQMKTAE